jgi:hypothetical protein
MIDFVDTEQMGYLLDDAIHRDDSIAAHVISLAMGKPKSKVMIGAAYTGKREYHWDSRKGIYSESMPTMSAEDRLIQAVLLAKPKPWWR